MSIEVFKHKNETYSLRVDNNIVHIHCNIVTANLLMKKYNPENKLALFDAVDSFETNDHNYAELGVAGGFIFSKKVVLNV